MRRLSSNAVSAVIGGLIVAVLSAGTAVAVTTSNVSVTDPTTGARARVLNGGVVVNARDTVPPATATLASTAVPPAETAYILGAHLGSVPAGGRFEVQTVSVQVTVPQGQRPNVWLNYVSNGKGRTYYLPVIYQASDPNFEVDVFSGAMDVHLYADAGSAIDVYTDRNAYSTTGPNQFYLDATVSGHTG